jgi:hypothetical protein
MDPEQVLSKTDKGREEIATRAHHLDAKHRRVLILVDGASTAGDIAAKVAGFDDGMAVLDDLLSGGFVSGGGGAAAPQAPPASVAAASPAATDSLESLKRLACSQVERLMGPDGDQLALRIENAGSREEFLAEARKVHAALSAFLGPKKADLFAKALGI